MGDWSKRRKLTFAGQKIIDIAKCSSPEDKIKLKSDKKFLDLVKYLGRYLMFYISLKDRNKKIKKKKVS